MAHMQAAEQEYWPNYTYIVPHIYTKAKVHLVGLGSYIPAGTITNEFFAYVATRLGHALTAEDVQRATGLQLRHVRVSTLRLCRRVAGRGAPGLIDNPRAPEDESLVDMAVIAAQRALASAGCNAAEVDTIIGASSSDNDAFPTLASQVQLRLGMRPVRSLMLKGACAGQTEALQLGSESLSAGSGKRVLIVTSEGLLSNVMHVLDWRLSSLFGEGSAAFLLERDVGHAENTCIINGSDAKLASAIFGQTPLRKDVIETAEVDRNIQQLYEAGRSAELNQLLAQFMPGYAKMDGKLVYREAPQTMAEAVDALCRHAQLSYDDLTYIVPHQPNSRITPRLGELLIRDYGWPASTMEKLVDNFRLTGNLSTASIATSLVELLREGRLIEGQWLALPAVGVGLNYGCCLTQFQALRNREAIM